MSKLNCAKCREFAAVAKMYRTWKTRKCVLAYCLQCKEQLNSFSFLSRQSKSVFSFLKTDDVIVENRTAGWSSDMTWRFTNFWICTNLPKPRLFLLSEKTGYHKYLFSPFDHPQIVLAHIRFSFGPFALDPTSLFDKSLVQCFVFVIICRRLSKQMIGNE